MARNYLIDTHVLIWQVEGDPLLSKKIVKIIENSANSIFISQASLWELAIKISIGKLTLSIPFEKLESKLIDQGYQILDFNFSAYKELLSLPFHHNDPFDRMIISQAKAEEMVLISSDKKFKLYEIDRLGVQ